MWGHIHGSTISLPESCATISHSCTVSGGSPSKAAEDYSNNPMYLYSKWQISVATKKWIKVIKFMGYRFNKTIENAHTSYNSNKDLMKEFLTINGVKTPDKFTFKNPLELASYIFNKSVTYKKLFKDVLFPAIKITINYYHREKSSTYKIKDVNFFFLINYKFVRKLKLHLKSNRIFFIKRDINGWYIYPKCLY